MSWGSESTDGSDSATEPVEGSDDGNPSESAASSQNASSGDTGASGVLPDIDTETIAPASLDRDEAAQQEQERQLLVWGPEGAGKSHVAHTAQEPIAYIDTEGKATDLSPKFDKRIHYFAVADYGDAVDAMEQSFALLEEYLEAGHKGTLVVDSMTKMWEFAKIDYAKFAYQTEDLSEVSFQSQLEGEKDWTKIKARHNGQFRQRILNSPYHVVMTAGRKEDYNYDGDDFDKKWIPDGESWNKYAVKDVVRLRTDVNGNTVADLRKASKTRYSFLGLEWPEWPDIYAAIDQIAAAEQADHPVDVTQWDFEVVKGQPVDVPSEGSNGGHDGGQADE